MRVYTWSYLTWVIIELQNDYEDQTLDYLCLYVQWVNVSVHKTRNSIENVPEFHIFGTDPSMLRIYRHSQKA